MHKYYQKLYKRIIITDRKLASTPDTNIHVGTRYILCYIYYICYTASVTLYCPLCILLLSSIPVSQKTLILELEQHPLFLCICSQRISIRSFLFFSSRAGPLQWCRPPLLPGRFFWLLIVTWSEFSIEVIKPRLILTFLSVDSISSYRILPTVCRVRRFFSNLEMCVNARAPKPRPPSTLTPLVSRRVWCNFKEFLMNPHSVFLSPASGFWSDAASFDIIYTKNASRKECNSLFVHPYIYGHITLTFSTWIIIIRIFLRSVNFGFIGMWLYRYYLLHHTQ